MRGMLTLAARLGALTYTRYVAVSAGALLADLALFSALLGAGLTAGIASATGYAFGILAHWLLSSRLVFVDDTAAGGAERTRQKALFLGSALVGLALTTGIVSGGAALGMAPHLAKLAAILISFQATYLARRMLVFRA